MATRPSQQRSRLTTVIRDGFTLIEVLVVVGILALLFAILLPSLSQARQQAARLGCASNLRTSGHALNLLRTESGRYPSRYRPADVPADPEEPPEGATTDEALDCVGNTAITRLVKGPLARPDPLYCPVSIERDPHAVKPYAIYSIHDGKRTNLWEMGDISYIYLAEIWNVFSDADGQPTFSPYLESPNICRTRSPRLVLLGDRTVELAPKRKNLPGSNHGREGGWFYFTTGDAQWWSWNRLTPHPGRLYTWYWPRLIRPPEPISPATE
jgi:prepilin-type N-terminal cleavage/methylation domain-containing protein